MLGETVWSIRRVEIGEPKRKFQIKLMKKPWTSDEPVYRGKTIAVSGVRFYPKPVQKQHPPIEITARAGDTRIRGK